MAKKRVFRIVGFDEVRKGVRKKGRCIDSSDLLYIPGPTPIGVDELKR
jgi:hypothetical protein